MLSPLKKILLTYLSKIQFYVQRFIGFKIPDSPHFDSEAATEWFIKKLKTSKNYLEYGSGGSTYLAAKYNIPFTTVDSDKLFLKAVKNKIKKQGLLNQQQIYHHADIGLTGPWGRPVLFKKPSEKRLAAFRRYSDPLLSSTPDLILIDGRFRVACALKILRQLKNETSWTLLVDDYAHRPQYHIIANYAKLDCMVGNMAVFTRLLDCDSVELNHDIDTYETIVD